MGKRSNRRISTFLLALLPFYLVGLAKLIWPDLFLSPYFVNSYLADLVAMPVYFSLVVLIRRYVLLRLRNYRLRLKDIIGGTLYVGIIFEILLPLYSPRFTMDLFDLVAYSIGSALYFFIQKRTLH